MTDPTSVDGLVARALTAYEGLVSLGEEIEDEWGYVQDLAGAWRAELETAANVRGAATASLSMGSAVDRLIDLIAGIDDPHRAIDWLSTFPQAVLLALGVDPWPEATTSPGVA